MVETIAYCVGQGLTALVAIGVYLYLVTVIYPRFSMRVTVHAKSKRGGAGEAYAEGDRGIRRFTFPEGRAILYHPTPVMRRFLRSYVLIKRDGCTYIKCRIHENIAHIRYDVITFDSRGRLLDLLCVSERVTERGYTRTVRLPSDTAYARVILRKADGMYTGREAVVSHALPGIAVFTGLTVITTAVVAYLLYDCLAAIIGELYPVGVLTAPWVVLAVAVVLGALCAAWTVLMYYLHSKKVMNR